MLVANALAVAYVQLGRDVAIAGWLLDMSAAARSDAPAVSRALAELAGALFVCPVGELDQLYSARSARDYDLLKDDLHANFGAAAPPPDIFDRQTSKAALIRLYVRERIHPLPPLEEDPLWSMVGIGDFEPSDIDETVYG